MNALYRVACLIADDLYCRAVWALLIRAGVISKEPKS